MSTTTTAPRTLTAEADVDAAARRLLDAEHALHDAHASGIDAWICAASDRLHEAVAAHLRLAAH